MGIEVTDIAKEKLVDVMKDSEYKKPALRIVFSGFGWGGPRLGLALDELEGATDHVYQDNDVDIILDDRMKNYMETGPTLKVDFRESAYGAGFIIDGGSSC